MRKALVIGGGLIALYLVVVNYTGSGTVINDSTAGGVNVVKAFQGR
jgi:hypothetical protein